MTASTDLAADFAALRSALEARLANDAVQEAAFARLHEELASYKQSFLADAERPLLLDLLMLFDTMQWFRARLTESHVDETIAESFEYLTEELLEALYRRDVTPLDPKDRFDPAIHHAVQVKPASSAADDGKVAQVAKRGFMRAGRVFRPEDVVVLRWSGASKQGGS